MRVVLTPRLNGTEFGSQDSNGYTLNWGVDANAEVNVDCTYDISFASAENLGGEKVYVELVSSNGSVTTIKKDTTLTDACYNMVGGSVRLMEKQTLKDNTLMEIPLPSINSVNVTINVAKDPTFTPKSYRALEQLTSFVNSLF